MDTVPTCAGAVRPPAAFAVWPSRGGAAAAADAPAASASGGLPPARTSSAQRPDACRPRQAATLDNFVPCTAWCWHSCAAAAAGPAAPARFSRAPA